MSNVCASTETTGPTNARRPPRPDCVRVTTTIRLESIKTPSPFGSDSGYGVHAEAFSVAVYQNGRRRSRPLFESFPSDSRYNTLQFSNNKLVFRYSVHFMYFIYGTPSYVCVCVCVCYRQSRKRPSTSRRSGHTSYSGLCPCLFSLIYFIKRVRWELTN